MAGAALRAGEIQTTVLGLLREIRPWQWYKQSMLLLGIVFSRSLTHPDAWVNVGIAIASFCAVAGAVYIYNDVGDVEEDRRHPVKRNRPIASGRVSVPVAVLFGCFLLAFGLALAFHLGAVFSLVVVTYLLQNLLYSRYLKYVAVVDILVVATGFVLRAIAGVVAIDVQLSPWLVVCTFLAALMLATGKRRHELEVHESPAAVRRTLGEYTSEWLDQLLVVWLAMVLMSYSLYTFFKATDAMMMTLPCAFFAAMRYHFLAHTTDVCGDPARLLSDRPFLLNLVFWVGLTVTVLYGVTLPIGGGS